MAVRPSGWIPPDSPAAETLHRALIAIQARRLDRRRHPRAPALARALHSVAFDRIPADERERIARVEARRTEVPFAMVAARAEFALGPGEGAGATTEASERADDPASRLGQAWHVCRWASIPPVWGRVLTRLVRELAPVSCLELGTGLGLSGAYQGSALELNGAGRLVTLDVHEAGWIAERGFSELGLEDRVTLRPGLIDETLPEVLERSAPIEFAFLDAEHTEAATTRHFGAVLPHLADEAVVVFDDINQTDEMKRAWRTVVGCERVSLAVPLRRIGIAVITGAGERAG